MSRCRILFTQPCIADIARPKFPFPRANPMPVCLLNVTTSPSPLLANQTSPRHTTHDNYAKKKKNSPLSGSEQTHACQRVQPSGTHTKYWSPKRLFFYYVMLFFSEGATQCKGYRVCKPLVFGDEARETHHIRKPPLSLFPASLVHTFLVVTFLLSCILPNMGRTNVT